jgi:hypothetical protein
MNYYHQHSSNCRKYGYNCQCGEYHEEFKAMKRIDFALVVVASIAFVFLVVSLIELFT